MCLAVPHIIVEIISPQEALAEAGGIRHHIRTDCLPSVSSGEMVLVHAGFAIEKVAHHQKEELAELWKELYAATGGENL